LKTGRSVRDPGFHEFDSDSAPPNNLAILSRSYSAFVEEVERYGPVAASAKSVVLTTTASKRDEPKAQSCTTNFVNYLE